MKSHGNFYSGTSGLVVPVAKALYPEPFIGKSRLAYYASFFNSIEINSSFYKLPKAETVAKWSGDVGDDFRFTFKLSKSITHTKNLQFTEEDVESFINVIDNAGEKRDCILIQFPPGLKFENAVQVEKLLSCIKRNNSEDNWKVAVEFRNLSWYNNEIFQMLDAYNCSLVYHDLPTSGSLEIALQSKIKYLRFHGPGGRYRGSYSDEFLLEHAGIVKEWMLNGNDVYCYFNNTMGNAFKNLQSLNTMVSAS